MSDMEVYRNSETVVHVPVPIATANYTYEVSSPGVEATPESKTAAVDVERKTIDVTIPFEHTLYDGTVTVDITIQRTDGLGGTYTFTEYVDVVTPLFTWHDLDGTYPADKVPELERLVRHVVEAFTGQHFGKTIKTKSITTNTVQNFDVPLIELRGVSDRYATHSTTLTPPKMSYEIADEGHTLSIDWDSYHVKTDSMWILDKKANSCVLMEGVFGYDRVPADVKEAALLIAGVWGCEQAVWRDRFIETMRSSDWSVTYNDGAFVSTGSATADQLLAKYSRRYVPEVF